MGEFTKISWATHTHNCWWGCTRIEGDPACGPCEGFEDGAICYAETWAGRTGFSETGSQFPIWGAHEKRRWFGDKHWNQPLKWNRNAAEADCPVCDGTGNFYRHDEDGDFLPCDDCDGTGKGDRARVFCMSMGDWAEGRTDQAPHLTRLWKLIDNTPSLDWLMLTKRPQLINKLCPLNLPRIWQGTTAVTQRWFDIRWEHLKEVESPIRWFSIEPMMERIILPNDFLDLGSRGWIVCGGQSGHHTIPIDPAWARSLLAQCREAGVRFHMKQMSGRTKEKLTAIPLDLMVREFPTVLQ